MNRRSIFKCLLGAVAASAMDVCGWVPPPKTSKELYENAAYEMVYFFHPDVVKKKDGRYKVSMSGICKGDRYDFQDGKWIPRPFHK